LKWLSPTEAAPTFGGVAVEALAERHGTPIYVYDADVIRERTARILDAFSYRPIRVFYSAKANPAVAVAAVVRDAGLGLDACSPGDLELARLAGFETPEISYTSFGATDEELQTAASQAATLVVDGVDELERIAATGAASSIGLRVNPAIAAGFHAHVMAGAAESKFGTPIAAVDNVRSAAHALGLRITGLHAHLGSDVLETAPHADLLRQLAAVARRWGDLEWINIGGGFGTPRRPSESEYDWQALDRAAVAELEGLAVELRLEPGGHITMDAGVLVTRVLRVVPDAPGRPSLLVVDTNTNHVISALLFAAHHPVALARESGDEATVVYRIVGNLMQAGDVLANEVALPPVRPGDLVLLGHVGAYSSCRSGVFNERPRPAEVLVDRGADRLIRRAESVGDLFSRDLGLSDT
jgi:diaminopimelate decarboxylase